MPGVKVVGRVEKPKIMVDAIALDVGAFTLPSDGRVLQVVHRSAVSAKRPFVLREALLQGTQVGSVQDESLKVDPAPIHVNFNPTVDDVPGGEPIGQTGDGTFLQGLVDGEAMESAGNVHGSEQRHQQGALGIALADAVCQHQRSRQVVLGVVAKRDLVTHEGIRRPNAIM